MIIIARITLQILFLWWFGGENFFGVNNFQIVQKSTRTQLWGIFHAELGLTSIYFVII